MEASCSAILKCSSTKPRASSSLHPVSEAPFFSLASSSMITLHADSILVLPSAFVKSECGVVVALEIARAVCVMTESDGTHRHATNEDQWYLLAPAPVATLSIMSAIALGGGASSAVRAECKTGRLI